MKAPRTIRTTARLGKNAVRTIRRFASQPHIAQMPTISAAGFRNVWAGYYDRSPFRPGDDDIILVHATDHPAWRRPSADVPASILLINWRTGQIVHDLGSTKAWNWQQGARALWLDARRVVYNIFDESAAGYRAKIIDVESGKEEVAPIPVQDIGSGQRLYSISYEALVMIRPDYGYRNITVDPEKLPAFGIDEYDLELGTVRRLVSVDDLARSRYSARTIERPKLNHLMIAPDGNSGCFLFRYFSDGRRVSDLVFLDIVSGTIRDLVLDMGAGGHCSWLNNHELIVTMKGFSGFGYYIMDVRSGHTEMIMAAPDGHPSLLRKGTVVSDTYPDAHGTRSLFTLDLNDQTTKEIGRFIEPLLFQGETRCDLHPTANASGTLLQIDLAEHHQRRIAVLELDARR